MVETFITFLKEIFNKVNSITRINIPDFSKLIGYDNKNNTVIFDNFKIKINTDNIIISYELLGIIVGYITRGKSILSIKLCQSHMINNCRITIDKELYNIFNKPKKIFVDQDYEKTKYYFDYYYNLKNTVEKYFFDTSSIIMNYLFLEYLNIPKINISYIIIK